MRNTTQQNATEPVALFSPCRKGQVVALEQGAVLNIGLSHPFDLLEPADGGRRPRPRNGRPGKSAARQRDA